MNLLINGLSKSLFDEYLNNNWCRDTQLSISNRKTKKQRVELDHKMIFWVLVYHWRPSEQVIGNKVLFSNPSHMIHIHSHSSVSDGKREHKYKFFIILTFRNWKEAHQIIGQWVREVLKKLYRICISFPFLVPTLCQVAQAAQSLTARCVTSTM